MPKLILMLQSEYISFIADLPWNKGIGAAPIFMW